MNVISVHFVYHEGIAQELDIVDNHRRGYAIALCPHILGDAVGRDNLSCIVGEETHQVLEECHVADVVA